MMTQPIQARAKQSHGIRCTALAMKQKDVHWLLTQVREHFPVIIEVIIKTSGAVKGAQVSGREQGSGDRQRHGHFQSLLAGQAHASLAGLIGVFFAKTASAFRAFSQRWILAPMRHQIPDDHFTFFCH
jgi:hypothetical protein